MRFAFIMAEKAQYPVSLLCSLLDVSRGGYYAWCVRPPSRRTVADSELVEEIRTIHENSAQRYGSPRIHEELSANDTHVGRKRVARLMKQNGISARTKRRFVKTTDAALAARRSKRSPRSTASRRSCGARPSGAGVTQLHPVKSPGTEGIVLNACYSQRQATALAKVVPHVVGMARAVGDDAALRFAGGFYRTLAFLPAPRNTPEPDTAAPLVQHRASRGPVSRHFTHRLSARCGSRDSPSPGACTRDGAIRTPRDASSFEPGHLATTMPHYVRVRERG